MSMRLGIGIGLSYRGAGGSAPAWQQRLTLAEDDGWAAAWDASNPNTRTLREDGGDSFTASLADGLGNFASAVQATEAKQPEFVAAGAGSLDLMRFTSASAQMLQTAEFGSARAIPFFVLAVVKFTGGTFAFTAENSTNFNSMRSAGPGNDVLFRAATTDLTVASAIDSNPHVYGLLFNDAASKGWFDKALAVEGDLNNSASFNQLALGSRADDSGHLNGDIALFYMYPGIPSDAVRNRMFDMVLDHGGITPGA